MVAIVVNIFLPHSIDFHEFDDPTTGDDRPNGSHGRNDSCDDPSESSKHDPLDDLFGREAGEDAPSPPSRPASSSVAHPLDTVAATRLPVRNQSSASLKEQAFGSNSTLQRPDHRRASSLSHISDWMNSKRVTLREVSIDSVLASSMTETDLKRLSTTDLPSLSLTTAAHGGSPETTFTAPPWSIVQPVLTNGGLVNAMLKSSEGKQTQALWIGTLSGIDTDRITAHRKSEISLKFQQEYDCDVLYVPDKICKLWYEHFCKITLWPIMNYGGSNLPKSQEYLNTSWSNYVNVNTMFAESVISNYKDGDTIWIHDYHLMMVPVLVREKIPDAKIGFFMHTCFPSPQIWKKIPSRKELLGGILGASLVLFQTQGYAAHFLQCCNEFLSVDTFNNGVQLQGRFVDVGAEAIRLTRETIEEVRTASAEHIERSLDSIKNSYGDRLLIFSRDKLDSLRGIREKLLSFELFLRKYPAHRQKVCLVQVATSTTELVERQARVLDIVSRINDEYSNLDSKCVDFWLQDIPNEHYIALLASADIMLSTALREGMGLTPQEFVYCQDGSLREDKKHGVLILSEFTGTASLLQGGELSCNPYDPQATAEAIRKAVTMCEAEKESRWQKMQTAIVSSSGGQWLNCIQSRLDAAHAEQSARSPFKVPRLEQRALLESYSGGNYRLLIVDDEGTSSAMPYDNSSFAELCDALRILSASHDNTVYITSAFDPPFMEEWYKSVPDVGLIAANGSYVRHPGSSEWEAAGTTMSILEWKNDIQDLLKHYLGRIDGATAVEEWSRIIIDYTSAKHPAAAQSNIADLCSFINTVHESQGLRASYVLDDPNQRDAHGKEQIAKKWLVIGTSKTTKHTAIEKICGDNAWQNRAYDWLLVAGDGAEDEPVMKWAHEMEDRERDLADRRSKASKAVEADRVDREATRERAKSISKAREETPKAVGMTVSPPDDEVDEPTTSNQLGTMRPLKITAISPAEAVGSVQGKEVSTTPLFKAWTIKLGHDNKETHARATLSGGPGAMVALLVKLAGVEQAASRNATNDVVASVDDGYYGDDETEDDGHGGAGDESEHENELELACRPVSGAHGCHSGSGAANEPTTDVGMPHYQQHSSRNASFEQPAPWSDGDPDVNQQHHTGPPSATAIARLSAMLEVSLGCDQIRSPQTLSTIPHSGALSFSSRDPSPSSDLLRREGTPERPVRGVLLRLAPESRPSPWFHKSPAVPLAIDGERSNAFRVSDLTIRVPRSPSMDRVHSRPSSIVSGLSGTSPGLETESDISENPNVRPGRDLHHILEAVDRNVSEAECPALDSSNESNYADNRKRELAEEAARKAKKIAREAARHGVSVEVYEARLAGSKQADHSGFLANIDEDKSASAVAQPDSVHRSVAPGEGVKHILTVSDLHTLLSSRAKLEDKLEVKEADTADHIEFASQPDTLHLPGNARTSLRRNLSMPTMSSSALQAVSLLTARGVTLHSPPGRSSGAMRSAAHDMQIKWAQHRQKREDQARQKEEAKLAYKQWLKGKLSGKKNFEFYGPSSSHGQKQAKAHREQTRTLQDGESDSDAGLYMP